MRAFGGPPSFPRSYRLMEVRNVLAHDFSWDRPAHPRGATTVGRGDPGQPGGAPRTAADGRPAPGTGPSPRGPRCRREHGQPVGRGRGSGAREAARMTLPV